MPRSSSNSSRSRAPSRPALQQQQPKLVQPQKQQQQQQPQPPQHVTVASSTGIFQSMKEGFGWGIGTSIARSMFGGDATVASAAVAPVAVPVAPVAPALAPQRITEQHDQLIYNKCMEDVENTHEMCKQYIIYSDTTIAQSNA